MNYLLNEISIQDKYAKETQLGKNKLSFDIFEKLCNLDPTTRPNKVGRYANWLLANYNPNTDWGQLHAALERFIDGVKRGILSRYNISNDINSFKSYDDFISVINTLSQSNDMALSSSEYNNRKKLEGQFEIIGSTSTFDIIKILTWQAERYFGGTTDWCTVANEFTFNDYTKKGPLYIIYPKDGDPSKKMQFHFEKDEYADREDTVFSDPKTCIISTLGYNQRSIELGKKCIEIWGEDKFIGICKIWDNFSDLAHFNILNINWELISKKWYDRITPTSLKQLYIVELNKLENIINEKGRLLSKDWYKEIEYDPQSQWFEATLPDYGKMFIYPNGSHELEQPIYPELLGDVCCKKTDDGILAVDSVGNPIINDILQRYTYYQHMIELITLEGKSIFLNDKGDEISELNGFDKMNVINRPNLIFAVYKNNNLNVYDFPNHRFLFNQWIPNAKIDKQLHVNGNRYAICKDGLYNVFDLNGNFLLKNWYERCSPVYDGRIIFSSKEVKEKAILNQDNTVQYITTESKQSIQLTMKDLKKMVLEAVNNIQKQLSTEEIVSRVISYIKGFGEKGKLPSCDVPFKSYFTPYLEEAYKWASEKVDEIRRDGFPYFKHLFGVDVINKFTLNKRGLIYVERAIMLDLDEDLSLLNYSSIGECWSWRKFNAQSYCASDRYNIQEKRNRVNVVICGYVHPDSIDWLETVYLNSYDMKNETEIRMKDNAYVEVAYIKIWGQKYRLGGSWLINASVDKYNKNKEDW